MTLKPAVLVKIPYDALLVSSKNAFLMRFICNGKLKNEWIPKKEIRRHEKARRTVVIPTWLAAKRDILNRNKRHNFNCGMCRYFGSGQLQCQCPGTQGRSCKGCEHCTSSSFAGCCCPNR